MALPPHARDWMDRAEIDYIGPFIKAWAAFNAWYRHASQQRRDAEALRFVKQSPNPVRNGMMPLLRRVQRDQHGAIIPDQEPAQKFKLLVRDLHVCLDNFHIEITRGEVVERISFRSVCLGGGVNFPQTTDAYGLRYLVERHNGGLRSSVRSIANPADLRAEIEQDGFSLDGLQGHEQYGLLSPAQQAYLRDLYRSCDPRPMTDLFADNGGETAAGDITFRCTDQQLFEGIIEVVYALRNTLLHGELQPHEQAFAAYEPAYRIVMRFLSCVG